ncbi:MAG: HAMP domain-containing sensor histidine kinase [Thermodesulfobacteriota bacterium]
MKNPGIHVRVLLATVMIIGLTTSTLSYIGVSITHQFAQKRFEEHISFLAKYLALNAELGILLDDRAMLERLAVNLLSERDVVGVVILDANGREMIRAPGVFSEKFPVMEAPVLLAETREESRAFGYEGQSRERRIGQVQIRYSTAGIDQLWETMVLYFIWIAAGLTCLAGLVFYFISRSLVAPVKELAKAAGRVALGNFNSRAEPGNLPEARELAVAFNVMLDSLERHRLSLEKATEQARRNKTLAEMGEFSLMIAHELKNPLGIIKSSLDMLRKDFDIPKDNILAFYIEDEIARLNRLIGDFLMFARPVAPAFQRTDLNALLREIVKRFELQAAGTVPDISVQIPPEPCFAQADSDLLMRAVSNILKNAYDVNGNDCRVEVKAIRAGNLWTAEIADNGEGIVAENIDKIFNPFFTTRTKGAGLGLAYTARAVRAHGGMISADNPPGGGALFRVEIPVIS